MTNQEYINRIYVNYEKYQMASKQDKFFNSHVYKRSYNVTTKMNFLLICLLYAMLSIGIAYASYTVMNATILRKPNTFVIEDLHVMENHEVASITKEEAIEKAIRIVQLLTDAREVEIASVELINNPFQNKVYWEIITKENIRIEIDSISETLISYYDTNIICENKAKVSYATAKEIGEKLLNIIVGALKDKKVYHFYELYKRDESSELWDIEFYVQYDGIFNPYEGISISYVPETIGIKQIFVFTSEFANNPITISEEEALLLAKEYVKKENIEEYFKNVTIEFEIRPIEKVVQGEMKSLERFAWEGNENFNVTRRVWSVKSEENVIYVDCTTGEIIGNRSYYWRKEVPN